MKPAIKLTSHNSAGWSEFYEVESDSRPGTAYVIAKNTHTGKWGCSCPAWIYQRGKKGDCKHIAHVIRQIQSGRLYDIGDRKPILTPEKIQKAVSRFSLVEI